MPYVEKNYRVLTDRANTAIAGLSMGGNHTLQTSRFPTSQVRLRRRLQLGPVRGDVARVTPGGRGGRGNAPAAAPAGAPATPPPPPPPPQPTAEEWEKKHAATLDNASLKKGLKVLWFAIGKDDFLLQTTNATVDLFKQHGFSPVFKETAGGHTWINWRNYLHEFAQQLFQ